MDRVRDRKRAGFFVSFLTLAAAVGGCHGEIGNASGAGSPGTGPGGTTVVGGSGSQNPVLTCAPGADPGATPLLRLSALQYRNTVKDLLTMSGVAAAATDVAAQ